MQGLMQDYPLTLPPVFDRAERLYGRKQIIWGTATGRERTTIAEWADRTRRMGGALDALGVPADLRAGFSATGDDYLRLLNWANPNLPDKTPDPYMRGLTPDEIDESSRRRSV